MGKIRIENFSDPPLSFGVNVNKQNVNKCADWLTLFALVLYYSLL